MADYYRSKRPGLTLAGTPNIPSASTFPDQRTATRAIAQALKARQSQIRQYLDDPNVVTNRPFVVDVGFTTGRSLIRGARESVDVQKVLVVIRKPLPGGPQPSTGYLIVSAFPTQ